jgi:hypothetical protein
LHHGEHLHAVLAELVAKEHINQVDVAEHVEEVHHLRDDQLRGPDVVSVQVVDQILGQHLH